MAELVMVEGQTYKKRHPLGVWALSFVTLGVYFFVWYYKINDETRRRLNDDTIKPGVALLAVLLGWIIIVPPFVSIYNTGERIRRVEEKTGSQNQISPALGLLAAFVFSLNIVYMQEHLNRVLAGAQPIAPGTVAHPPPPA